MLNFKIISKIFFDFLHDSSVFFAHKEKLNYLIWLNIKTNQELWNLEDLARMVEFGSKHVSTIKQKIDKNNQIRNDIIREIDIEISDQIDILSDHQERFYSESPGMIIDRLAILFIKLSVVHDLLLIIEEKHIQEKYQKKEKIILKQISRIGNFLDFYFIKLARKEVFFEIQQPVKIYNDNEIKKYIKILKNKRTNSS